MNKAKVPAHLAREAYEQGREIGLQAIENLDEALDTEHNGLEYVPQGVIGILETVMTFVYDHAPTDEAAQETFDIALGFVADNRK